MARKILLLEDNHDLGVTIKELLEDEGYEMTLVVDGIEAEEATFNKSYDLYVFDINVPEVNGLDLLDSLRNAQDKTPAIFISALVDLKTISRGFEVGANDYIKKPFFPEELLLRVNAKFAQDAQSLVYKNISYQPNERIIKKDGKALVLGEVQEKLFDLFMHNITKVIDKDILLECLDVPSSSGLRVALSKLKQTTGLEIKNLRGVGYILEES